MADFSKLEFADDQIYGTFMNFNHLEPNTKFYWRVRGKNEGGLGPWSAVWSFTTVALGSVGEGTDHQLSLTCAPNPVGQSARIAFELSSDDQVSLRVLNLLGIEVADLGERHYPAGRHELLWSPALSSGTYMLECRTKAALRLLPIRMIRK